MDPRRWWLLAGAAPAALACAGAVVDPGLRSVADLAVAALAVLASALLWCAAGGAGSVRRSWRLLALAPLPPALGTVVAIALAPPTPLAYVVLRWVLTVPGYLLGVVGLLSLAGPGRWRRGGLRPVVEVLIFLAGCLVTVQMLVLGPDRTWGDVGVGEQLVLGSAVLVLSAAIAAALTNLGHVDASRQHAAVVLFGGYSLLTVGRGLASSALLVRAPVAVDASRLLLVAGLTLFVLAGLLDTRPASRPARPVTARTTVLGQLLPHAAMVVAAAGIGAESALGHQPSLALLAPLVACVLLATVHRWLTLREERRLSGRLGRSEAYFRSLVRSGADAVLILDGDLRVSWASPALERMVGGASARALVGQPLLEVVHPQDVAALAEVLPGASPVPGDDDAAGGLQLFRLRGDDGEWRFLEAGLSDLRRDTDVGAVVLHCRDMTERLAREQALQSIAYTDPMTGLPNSAGWLRALEAAVADPDGGPAAVLLIELEGVAEAREHAGRGAVTAVVAEIGVRLRATVRGEDLVARLGGGAFAVVATGTPDEADLLASRCLAVVEQPIATAGGVLELTAGIGVAPVVHGLPVEDLRARVELAARAAHAAGPGTAVQYSDRLGDAAARRDTLREALAGAAGRGELSLAYLPVVDLADQRVRGVEALVRWRHPQLGQVPPAEFLPVAEAAGLIGQLQRWVLATATEAVAALPAGPLRVGVNLSGAYLRGGTAVADVQAALAASGLPADRLVVEITDAALLAADERVALDVAGLRLMGVHVALDDFGTGNSALGHLTALPLDILKLDVSLVARVDKDPQALALCRSIVDIGRALGLQVGAEGVETPAQLAALLGLGFDVAQGFLLARPMPLGALTALLAEGAGQLWPGLVGHR